MPLPPRLAEVLRDPPRDFSPTAIWWWSGEPLRADRLRWQLTRFAAGGVYNLVILNLAPSAPMFDADADDPPFFSEAWWALLEQVCADAAELGIRLWFYDQLGFSGAAIQASLVHEVPAYAGQWLEPGGGVAVRGFDYLSAEACAALLDRVHGEFERRLGHRLGGVIAGSFQDELPTIPTWSSTFADEFARRRGYDIKPFLPLMRTSEVRRDYQRTRAELAEEAFFRPLAEWHAKHGLLSGCDQQDPARAGHPVEGVRLYADYARTHRWFSAPGSDHHGDARIHSSLAHLYGRPRTWIEAFHSSGWGGTLEETFDWLVPWLRAGANLYNPHAVYYTTKGGWWEWAPPSTDWRQPYWAHHHVFAGAVTRLCAALSLGRHACDIAVLLPTVTVQAGTRLDGVDPDAARAQEVYRALVGDMTWFRPETGALDRLGLDADVIDDDSVRRATVHDGRLTVAGESYAAIVLPATTALDPATEERLAEFAAAGGLVVAVGAAPPPGARHVATPDDLGPLLAPLRRVHAPVPPLVREVDGATLVFLPAAFPGASRVTVSRPDGRGVDAGWAEAVIDFDPTRYAREATIRVRDVTGAPLLVDLFDGSTRPLPARDDGDAVEVTVPFDAPAALLVWDDFGEVAVSGGTGGDSVTEVAGPWQLDLVATLDDTWGDFGVAATLQRWGVEHRLDGGEWRAAHATFGPHGQVRVGAGDWRPAVYSTSRGIHKDPIHVASLGPKGHVPQEFLDFGPVAAGEPAWFRAELTIAKAGHLRVGAAAAKLVRLDGREVPLDDRGYLALGPAPAAGTRLLEVRLTPDEPVRLRAHVSLVRDPAAAIAPEWLVAQPGPAEFTTRLAPAGGVLQVASTSACRVLVDGVEIGRQGGFDPYDDEQKPRVRRYDVEAGELALRVEDGAAGVLADGCATTGPGWTTIQNGRSAPARIRRAQFRDPGSLQLPRREHPLPETGWLSGDARPTTAAAFGEPGTAGRVEWLRFSVPPGAIRIRVRLRGAASLSVDGVPLATGTGVLEAALEGRRGVREGLLRVVTEPGHSGGAILTGPIEFDPGPGPIELGDWSRVGLAEYSGGVRYRTTLDLPSALPDATLDLGRVRGTASVRVNGVACGVRICSPYRFATGSALRAGRNELEIEVYGTLAPYLDAVSPTHFVFPGQSVTGLFGPVTVRA